MILNFTAITEPLNTEPYDMIIGMVTIYLHLSAVCTIFKILSVWKEILLSNISNTDILDVTL